MEMSNTEVDSFLDAGAHQGADQGSHQGSDEGPHQDSHQGPHEGAPNVTAAAPAACLCSHCCPATFSF